MNEKGVTTVTNGKSLGKNWCRKNLSFFLKIMLSVIMLNVMFYLLLCCVSLFRMSLC